MLRNKLRTALLLGSITFLSACGPSDESQSRAARLNSSRNAAVIWTQKAEVAAATSSETTSFINRIQRTNNSLKNSKLYIDLDDNGPCGDNTPERFTLAWVAPSVSKSEMNICVELFNYSNDVISQVLIHESLHLTDTANLSRPTVECETTVDELKIMTYAQQMAFRNAYVDDDACSGFDYDYDMIEILSHLSYRLMFSDEFVPRKRCRPQY